jgi:polar amino acid transport system substrate-binding protein
MRKALVTFFTFLFLQDYRASCLAVPLQVTVAAGEFPPWTTETHDQQGIFSEIVRAAFTARKINIKLRFMPWQQTQQLINSGQVFAVFPYVKTPAREQTFLFSDPVMLSVSKLFYNPALHPEPPAIEHLQQLSNFRIVGAYGQWYQRPFKKAGLQVDYVNTELQQLSLISSGRFDLAPIDQVTANVLIKQNIPVSEAVFEAVSFPDNVTTQHMMISRIFPNAKLLLQEFNKGLTLIRSNGHYREILIRNSVDISEEYREFIATGYK